MIADHSTELKIMQNLVDVVRKKLLKKGVPTKEKDFDITFALAGKEWILEIIGKDFGGKINFSQDIVSGMGHRPDFFWSAVDQIVSDIYEVTK
jgi:uncharacterized protein YajQ (UPF0234 family)